MDKQPQKVLAFIVALALSVPAFGAECDTSTIKKQADGSYSYTKDCHVSVGEALGELDLRREEVKLLRGSLTDMNAAYGIQQKRAESWLDTSLKLEDTIQRQKRINDLEKWLWFGAGCLLMYGAAQSMR